MEVRYSEYQVLLAGEKKLVTLEYLGDYSKLLLLAVIHYNNEMDLKQNKDLVDAFVLGTPIELDINVIDKIKSVLGENIVLNIKNN